MKQIIGFQNKDPSPIVYRGGIDLKSETDIAKDEVKLRPCIRDARSQRHLVSQVKWGKNDLGDQVHVHVRKCGTNLTKYVPRIEGHGDMPLQKYF